MLSSQEQLVWEDVQRFWAVEAEEPPRLAPAARGEPWERHDPEDWPVAVAAGVWLTIALVLFGAVLAGVAVAAATAVGWALWHNRRRPSTRCEALSLVPEIEDPGRAGGGATRGPKPRGRKRRWTRRP